MTRNGASNDVGAGAAGYRAFLHRFEQRRLRLGRGAVDFVGQHEIGEYRPGLKTQILMPVLVGLHDHAADDVAGHQIRRKLDPRIAQIQARGKAFAIVSSCLVPERLRAAHGRRPPGKSKRLRSPRSGRL